MASRRYRNGGSVFGRTVVCHAEEEAESLRVVRVGSGLTVEWFECARSLLEIAGLEEGQTEIELEPGHGWIESECPSIESDSLGVVLLVRFQEAEVSEGFGVIGMSLQDGLPGSFSVGESTLLLEGKGGVALG